MMAGKLTGTEPRTKTRKGYVTLAAKNPFDDGEWDVLVAGAKIDRTRMKGMGATLELAKTVPFVLRHPTAMFRGVRSEGERGWICYCGVPKEVYDHRTDQAREPWLNQVFLVFVNYPDRVVYNWQWRTSDAGSAELPDRHKIDFHERIL